MNCSQRNFTTGEQVPASGVYSVTHAAHRLALEVALFKGELFPKCARCAGEILFSLVRTFSGLDAAGQTTFRVQLYVPAVLEDVEPRSAA